MYNSDDMNAKDAKSHAQALAFGPILFQATQALRDLGILTVLDNSPKRQSDCETIAQQCGLSVYGVSVLLDVGLSARVVYLDNGLFTLSKVGFFILHDDMTRVNMDFCQDICYRGMDHLQEAIVTGKPAGLKELGPWPTIYPALSELTPQQKSSWFAFDHFYSDQAFPVLLQQVFAIKPRQIFDIGGNTGRWARKCVEHDNDVEVTIVDLPQQTKTAAAEAEKHGYAERIHTHAIDLLVDDTPIPSGADVYWMSQFLDCFSSEQIVSILHRVKEAMRDDAVVYILELFWDRQAYEAAALSLNCTSLYFTVLANGNSHFYHSEQMLALIEEAGLTVIEQVDGVGLGHSLIKCSKSP
ncbi:L-tyrosine C(3)-methyltransferase [Sinobacterium norvegicum]|uniref:L-tyrosine C(3)-methyltransferase n=1 Tax=Sinobacterium norvegicum TaxID=1641715 RepID=A0ABM9AEA7_9GAMM|nr:methyltransferase [Sinobacterium norvegicum]CAH0991530.1 L-tyrosine C(3)-methyltransferase [Sinobacterium norvegicum]